jgi:hypothetical protein
VICSFEKLGLFTATWPSAVRSSCSGLDCFLAVNLDIASLDIDAAESGVNEDGVVDFVLVGGCLVEATGL